MGNARLRWSIWQHLTILVLTAVLPLGALFTWNATQTSAELRRDYHRTEAADEGEKFRGLDFLKAYVVGCEVGPRVGLAVHGAGEFMSGCRCNVD